MRIAKAIMATCILGMGLTAHANVLKALDKSEIPTMDIVKGYLTQSGGGTGIPAGQDVISVHAWNLKIEPETDDQNGQLFVGIEFQIEGSPTHVFRLPIEGVSKIESLAVTMGSVEVDEDDGTKTSLPAATSVTVTYKLFNWNDPGAEIEQKAKLEILYSNFGYYEKVNFVGQVK